ncbi:hypothetical protein HMPREF0388_1261 [Mobiluncus curtisii ATCC 51333]|uniref:Uncharacterized protein n=1 Tax=Mobiluncus curtisii ATCC 51333 TaxID=887326 RepID=E6LZH4_9ACTO|nr:hypothetical protein HMPREF0388_1261 [Mobiluncus curtisii ATCC 51333]
MLRKHPPPHTVHHQRTPTPGTNTTTRTTDPKPKSAPRLPLAFAKPLVDPFTAESGCTKAKRNRSFAHAR